MDIKKLSASAMESAELCVAKWDADNKAGRTGQASNIPAMVGSSCHGGAEEYVKQAIMENLRPATWETLHFFYMQSYSKVFGSLDPNDVNFKDGERLLRSWYARTSFEGFKVLMVEEKLNFQVPTGDINPDGTKETIPVNFIFDRFDQMGENEYRVVDYKSLQEKVNHETLHKKIQPRIYGLAAQILYPNATRIWVGFDMWRWDSMIETFFTREDNIETWNRIKRAVRKVKDTDPDDIPETLNSNCGFCVKQSTCGAVLANARAGGVHTYKTIQEKLDARALLKYQADAAERAYKELDTLILAQMSNDRTLKISSDLTIGEAKVRNIRTIHPEHVRRLAGEALFDKYGSLSMNIKSFEALLADPALPEGVKSQLEASVTRVPGNPYLATKENR